MKYKLGTTYHEPAVDNKWKLEFNNKTQGYRLRRVDKDNLGSIPVHETQIDQWLQHKTLVVIAEQPPLPEELFTL